MDEITLLRNDLVKARKHVVFNIWRMDQIEGVVGYEAIKAALAIELDKIIYIDICLSSPKYGGLS